MPTNTSVFAVYLITPGRAGNLLDCFTSLETAKACATDNLTGLPDDKEPRPTDWAFDRENYTHTYTFRVYGDKYRLVIKELNFTMD